MVRFYKIIKLTIAVITTSIAISSKPTPPTHTTEEQHRNIATTCHPRWRTTQGKNATNRIIRRRIELIASNISPKRPITKQTAKIRTTKITHNNPTNKGQTKKKRTQQKGRIPLPNFATPKPKKSLGWYHTKNLHNTTNETPHNNHTGRQLVNNPFTIKITNYPPQTNANPKLSHSHAIPNSKPPNTPEPRPNDQPPWSNAITVEDLPNRQAQMQDSNAAQPQKGLPPTTIDGTTPPTYYPPIALPPTPNPSHLREPTKTHPTTWFTWEKL